MTYDPNVGRWLEEDPIGFDAGDMDLYRLEGNNPVNEVDPSGLESFYSDGGYLQYVRDQEIARMRFYRTPESGSRLEFQGSTVMEVLGFRKHTSIWPWAPISEEYRKLTMGCFGLAYIRLNLNTDRPPWLIPGAKGYTDETSALEEWRKQRKDAKESQVVVLYAIQYSNKELQASAVKPGSNEYDLSELSFIKFSTSNFATAALTSNGTIRFWEWLSAGQSSNPDLITKHGAELPGGYPGGTIYVVATIDKHKYAMPEVK